MFLCLFYFLLIKESNLLLHILLNPVPCGADGLLGDAHDAVDGLIVHTHFVEDEEEGVTSPFL